MGVCFGLFVGRAETVFVIFFSFLGNFVYSRYLVYFGGMELMRKDFLGRCGVVKGVFVICFFVLSWRESS